MIMWVHMCIFLGEDVHHFHHILTWVPDMRSFGKFCAEYNPGLELKFWGWQSREGPGGLQIVALV